MGVEDEEPGSAPSAFGQDHTGSHVEDELGAKPGRSPWQEPGKLRWETSGKESKGRLGRPAEGAVGGGSGGRTGGRGGNGAQAEHWQ